MNRRLIVAIAAAAVLLVGAGVAGALVISGHNTDKSLRPAYLGASLQNLPFDLANIVTGIDGGSPAEKAGLTYGDSLEKIDGHGVKTKSDVQTYIAMKHPGETVDLTYWRLGSTKTASVKLAAAPKDPLQTKAGQLEFGTVKAASDKSLKVGLALSNREVTYEVTKATTFWRSFDAIKTSDLKAGDAIMVISVDGGKSALGGVAY